VENGKRGDERGKRGGRDERGERRAERREESGGERRRKERGETREERGERRREEEKGDALLNCEELCIVEPRPAGRHPPQLAPRARHEPRAVHGARERDDVAVRGIGRAEPQHCGAHGAPGARGLHSSTFQLNLSAFYGTGGPRRGYVARVKGVLGGVQGV